MPWNWQLPGWPHFLFDSRLISAQEQQFLLGVGGEIASLKALNEHDHKRFMVEILSVEGLESSLIEGEVLDRDSLQSSIQRQFGLRDDRQSSDHREAGMAAVLFNVYDTFETPLSHDMLWKWHQTLFKGYSHIEECGAYRAYSEPMQIVSRRYDRPRVFFEAPPSSFMRTEMDQFVNWFNTFPLQPILVRAAVAHVYFESIHPFEDGNGRIGRLLIEKALSQGVSRPILVAVSKVLEKRKRDYYSALERCNQTLHIDPWIEFFASAVLQAQEESMALLDFLITKAKFLASFADRLNDRQEKVLLRMFAEGVEGFKGGLSADKYIAITKTSRATATRDLADLVEKGALRKTGELRHTRYWLNLKALPG